MRPPIAALAALLLMAGCGTPEEPEEPAKEVPAPTASAAPADRDASVMLARERPAGAWPGANGLSGVNGDPVLDTASVQSFCTARGRSCPIAHTYTERTSFAAMTTGSSWTFEHFADFPGVLVISQGLVPEGGEAQMAGCAAGEFDDLWRGFGTLMTRQGRADSIVRLGWEVNVEAMPWRGLDTQTYISCFRRAATALRATNPKVLIDWTVNAHRTPAGLCGGLSTNCYPGDDYVDIVGIDNYDHFPWSPTKEVFDRTAARPEGLTWLYDFARERGKPFSVGEWGVVPTADAGKENPDYVKWMHEWFAAHAPALAYEAYFSDCSSGGVQSSLFNTAAGCRRNPGSADMYRSLYRQ
ncbi:glycoside hydrolase family 26 protein [Paractinoplanes rishiriensis]|uniref:GH26 domain-containing protein n=1 Tax=Paractinoplanes rishiriensis TaxID=1050105 RepID=A0A919MUF9_9ACTN|nr:glycosyl hydrolase [Actinoplanes rishiriensis]GIF00297.1 hypothetical protein Ari01nite_77610 [Actinoplanes rishiriensis]